MENLQARTERERESLQLTIHELEDALQDAEVRRMHCEKPLIFKLISICNKMNQQNDKKEQQSGDNETV